jgi:hypothetical protein
LGDFETWRLSVDEFFGTLMMQNKAITTRIQRLEAAPPPPPPPAHSWVNPLDLNQAPQPSASMSECGGGTTGSHHHSDAEGGVLGHPPPRQNMGMHSDDTSRTHYYIRCSCS